MKLSSTYQMGSSINLIQGLKPDWDFSQKANPFFAIQSKPLRESDIEVTPTPREWGYPEISLHDSAEDLLSVLLPFDIAHAPDESSGPVIRSGYLLIADRDRPTALASLSGILGVDLANPDHRYALVQIRSAVGTAYHAGYHDRVFVLPNPTKPDPALAVDEEFRRRMTQVRPEPIDPSPGGSHLNLDRANGCLSLFRTYGTHFVSKVEAGDRIFQVFAYPSDRFKAVRAAYASGENPLSGHRALSFSYYTTPAKPGNVGFVSAHGHILSASGDPSIAKSVKAGEWLEATFAKTASVFQVYEPDSKVSLDRLDRDFTQVSPIRVELMPLSVFAEFMRRQAWRRVFKAAMYQKFTSGVEPRFVKTDDRDYRTLIPLDDTGLVSTIATPSINTYKERLNLAEMQIVGADQVKEFTLFANCLQHSGGAPVAIPGQSVALAAHIMSLDPREAGGACAISVEDAAFGSLQLACQDFHGALLVTNRSATSHFVVVDGLRFESQDDGAGRWDVHATADIRSAPPPTLLPRIKDSLQFSMVFAEAVVSDQNTDATPLQTMTAAYFRWIADVIPATAADIDLLDLRLRALDLGRTVRECACGVFVPILPYVDYEEDVKKILSYVATVSADISEHQQAIARRKSDELVIDVGKTLNQNIIQSGQLLSGMVSANAAHMNQMAQYYDSIIETTRSEYQQQTAKLGELERMLVEARSAIRTAVEGYKAAVKAWQEIEWVKFGLNVAVDLFKAAGSLAVADAKPKDPEQPNDPEKPKDPDKPGDDKGGEILKSFGELVKHVQNAYDIVNTTSALYDRADKSDRLIKEAMDSLDKADPLSSNPSLLPWEELTVRFDTVMKAGPQEVATTELKEAFSILILRGKAMVIAKANASRLAREVYLNQRKKELNKDQAARLNALDGALKPANVKDLDRSQIDLIGLTGKLLFLRKQMLAMLAKSFALQDRALQYQYLQPATTIDSLSLLDVKAALVRQQGATTNAKTTLGSTQPSTTQPIRFEIPCVEADSLIRGKEYAFTITSDAHVLIPSAHQSGGPADDWTDPQRSTLRGYATVRLKSAVASVRGLPDSAEGEYRLKLEFRGNPFLDRDLRGNPTYFRTVPRSRVYEYFFKDNQPKFSDRGESWSEGVSLVTPFSTWAISMPGLSAAQAARLAGRLLTIRLTFVMEARVLPEAHRAYMAALAAGVGPQKEALVAAMARQGSVTNGWDVVFNMGLEQINRSLAAQYEVIKAQATYANRIKVEVKTQSRVKRCDVMQFEVEYGPPKLEFLDNNTSSVRLTTEILEGTLRQCEFHGSCADAKESDLDCDPARNLAGETLTATIPIQLLDGKVAPQQPGSKTYSVVVDLARGTFDASHMQLSDDIQVEFNRALKLYFVNNPIQFILNTLDLSNIATVEDLQPHEFRFKNLQTPSGQKMLQLYINTARRSALVESQMFLNNTPEPIPFGYDCSLMVSSRVFFGGVLPAAAASGWTLRGNGEVRDTTKAWAATYEAGELTGAVDFTAANFTVAQYSDPNSNDSCVWEYTFSQNQAVAWPVKGMILKPAADGVIRMTYESKGEFTANANIREVCTESRGVPRGPRAFKSEVTVSASATLPTDITGKDRDQMLKFNLAGQTFPISGHMSGGGPFGCDDLQARLNTVIAEKFPPQLARHHNISFASVSLFALKNLLFPADNYIILEDAYVPGDLLILGNFPKKGS